MLDEIFNYLIRGEKQKNLPCEYEEWKFLYGCYQRRCTKCGARQVRTASLYDSDRLVESHCEKLGVNTFRNYEKESVYDELR